MSKEAYLPDVRVPKRGSSILSVRSLSQLKVHPRLSQVMTCNRPSKITEAEPP